MTKFYSKSTNGFYDPEINKTMPSDVVQISDEFWESLLSGQSTQGLIITSDENGNPINAPQPAPTNAELLDACKTKAMSLLQATDWATLSDVTNGTPKLINQTEFLTYRSEVRALAVNPVANPTFPPVPTEQWG